MKPHNYKQYLSSEHWRTLARLRREFDNDQCAVCGGTTHLQVHHKTYERAPYCEHMSDIVTLCDKCHKLFHSGGG